eukprot:scaffold3808_cov112-Isochrysis_galbana.AAC.3
MLGPKLQRAREALVPNKLSEPAFWDHFFSHVDVIKVPAPRCVRAAQCMRGAPCARPALRQPCSLAQVGRCGPT